MWLVYVKSLNYSFGKTCDKISEVHGRLWSFLYFSVSEISEFSLNLSGGVFCLFFGFLKIFIAS